MGERIGRWGLCGFGAYAGLDRIIHGTAAMMLGSVSMAWMMVHRRAFCYPFTDTLAFVWLYRQAGGQTDRQAAL